MSYGGGFVIDQMVGRHAERKPNLAASKLASLGFKTQQPMHFTNSLKCLQEHGVRRTAPSL